MKQPFREVLDYPALRWLIDWWRGAREGSKTSQQVKKWLFFFFLLTLRNKANFYKEY
jgi:hypothetical protein